MKKQTKNEQVKQDSDEIIKFKDIYQKLLSTLIYDEEFAEIAKAEDEKNGLSAYQIQQKNVERTKIEKRGTSEIFSMRLSEELTSLGIENYLVKYEGYDSSTQWANLYDDNGTWMVADITSNIENEINNNVLPEYFDIQPRESFIVFHANSFVLDEIEDNGKKLEELETKPLYKFGVDEKEKQEEEEKPGELIVIEKNIFKRIINKIKAEIKRYIDEHGLDVLFKPYEPPEREVVRDEEIEEIMSEINFVPKVEVDEMAAIKTAEEKKEKLQSQEKEK